MNNAQYKALTAFDCANKLIEAVKEQKKALIIAHRNPDGDAVGSAFALKMIYEDLGGIAYTVCAHEVPNYLRFMEMGKNRLTTEIPEDYNIIITVDTASPTQFGELEYLCDKVDFAIDHHASCTEYSDSYRDGTACAAGELIFKIYEILKEQNALKENADIARMIYAAISADSGSFKYSNTTKNTHIIASKLTEIINSDENGINCAEIARLIHDSSTINDLKAKKLCIEKLNLSDDGKVAYICLEKKEYEKEGLTDLDFGASVDIPRSIEGVMVAFVIKEGKQDEIENKIIYRISARSNCNINVAEICAKFGGGGHAKAAGGAVKAENMAEALNCVLKEFINATK